MVVSRVVYSGSSAVSPVSVVVVDQFPPGRPAPRASRAPRSLSGRSPPHPPCSSSPSSRPGQVGSDLSGGPAGGVPPVGLQMPWQNPGGWSAWGCQASSRGTTEGAGAGMGGPVDLPLVVLRVRDLAVPLTTLTVRVRVPAFVVGFRVHPVRRGGGRGQALLSWRPSPLPVAELPPHVLPEREGGPSILLTRLSAVPVQEGRGRDGL